MDKRKKVVLPNNKWRKEKVIHPNNKRKHSIGSWKDSPLTIQDFVPCGDPPAGRWHRAGVSGETQNGAKG